MARKNNLLFTWHSLAKQIIANELTDDIKSFKRYLYIIIYLKIAIIFSSKGIKTGKATACILHMNEFAGCEYVGCRFVDGFLLLLSGFTSKSFDMGICRHAPVKLVRKFSEVQ